MTKLPESLDGLSIAELNDLLTALVAEQKELAALSDEDLTDDKLTELEAAGAAAVSLREQISTVEAAEAARTARVDAARAAAKQPEATDPPVEPEPEEDKPAEEPIDEVVIPDDASELEKEKELVTASAVARAASKAPAVVVPDPVEPEAKRAVIIAAANVPEFNQGQVLNGMEEVTEAFSNRTRGFTPGAGAKKAIGGAKGSKVLVASGSVHTLSDSASRFGLARIQKPENEFSTGMDAPVSEQLAVIDAAGKESSLPNGSLVAAGGWCAPSETLYGPFCSFETVSGILSIPEVSISRGGINFTKGPDYATLAATWGFLQTEAEAEAGTEKVCYEIDCPTFSEVRLDAIGFCVTNGVLTNVGYPELTRRVLEIGLVAHAHKVNASVISRISTLIGTAIDYAEVGSVSADILDGISLQATRLRYVYSMSPTQTIEAVLPVWAKEIVRSDLSRRTGIDLLGVTDAQISAWFGVRNIAAQFVYDYQPLATANTGTWTSWPDTLEVMLYPSGAFIKGTTPVLNLDTIYDSVGLSTNTYTAAFFEEGLLVANRCGSGVKVSIDTACLAGVTGAAELTCIVTP